MKRHIKAEGLKTNKRGLVVYLVIEVGTTVRFASVEVPWSQVAEKHAEIVDGCERVFTAQLEADANVLYLPLEKWE